MKKTLYTFLTAVLMLLFVSTSEAVREYPESRFLGNILLGSTTALSQKELRFYEGTNYVALKAGALTANQVWILPLTDGTVGQVMKTDGSGNLGWTSSTGQTNTASNVGSVGTGVWKQKTGVDLEFYKLNSVNNILAIAKDGNDKIDFTIVVGNISHDLIADVSTSDHHVKTTDTNTNAGTECTGATTYLNGEAGCVDTSAVYVNISGSPNANEFLRYINGTTAEPLTASEVRTALNVVEGSHTVSSDISHDSINDVSTSDHHVKTVSNEIDHDQTINFVDNEHIDYTNTNENILTTGNISLGADNAKLYFGDNQEASIYYDSTESDMVIKTQESGTGDLIILDGYVGVGTSNPSSLLDIGGGSADSIDGVNDILVADDIEVDGKIHGEKAISLHGQVITPSTETDHIQIYGFTSGGNETADTTVLGHFDIAGSGNPVNSAVGTVTFTNVNATQQTTTTKFLPATLQLDAITSEHVTINNMWSTDTGGWSIDFFMNVNDITAENPIFTAGNNSNSDYMQFRSYNNGNFRFRLRTSNTNRITITAGNGSIFPGAWTHIRAERTDDNYYLYINGTLIGSGSNSNDPVNMDNWEIGTDTPRGQTDYFDGYFDELRIYMDSNENHNGADFEPPTVPYDTITGWMEDEHGNTTPLALLSTSIGTGSFWRKLPDKTLVYSVNDLNRFVIPPQGPDNATNVLRSFIVSGVFQDFGDEVNAYSCSANGFDKLPCDTDNTGADMGVQNNLQVLGAIYGSNGSVNFDGEAIITTGSISIDSDSARLYLGNNQDASIYFDGVDIVSDTEINVPDDAYNESNWNGDLGVPTKNAVRDKIEGLASTDLTDTADILYEAELDSFSELQTQIGDKTLINEEDAIVLDDVLEVNNVIVFTSEYSAGSTHPYTVDWNNGNKQFITLDTIGSTVNFTDPASGVSNFLLRVVQGAGGETVTTWDTDIKWPTAGTAPTLSSGAGEIDIISCYWNGTNYYCAGSLDFQ